MSTINISLPSTQVTFVDQLVKRYGFSNRSEFIRSLLRLIAHSPDAMTHAATFPFDPPTFRSSQKIMEMFQKSGKYSSGFLKDLSDGLKDNTYFSS